MTQTIDRVRTKIEGPGQVFEFDSSAEKAAEGPIATLLTPLAQGPGGAEFSFKMDGRGQLSDIKVPQKLLDSLSQAGPAAAAGGMFSEEGMKNLISQSSLSLPEGARREGDELEAAIQGPLADDRHLADGQDLHLRRRR